MKLDKSESVLVKSEVETCFTTETENDPRKNKYYHLISEISKNINLLEESVKESHGTERMIFQNELQLLIDRHRLDFELDREKCKNERLKRLNNADGFTCIPRSESSEIRCLKNKCQNLTAIMKRRANQINKALAQIRDLKKDKETLRLQIKERDERIKEMFTRYSEALLEMDNKIRKVKEQTDMEKQNIQNNLEIALQEQINQNQLLIYTNCQLKTQLKTQLIQSKIEARCNVSTQVSFLPRSNCKDISG